MGKRALGPVTSSIGACLLYAMAVTLVACATEKDPEVAASREALSDVLSADERSRLSATDEEPDAFGRLRARQELANRIANERMDHRPTGEARPELSALYRGAIPCCAQRNRRIGPARRGLAGDRRRAEGGGAPL